MRKNVLRDFRERLGEAKNGFLYSRGSAITAGLFLFRNLLRRLKEKNRPESLFCKAYYQGDYSAFAVSY